MNLKKGMSLLQFSICALLLSSSLSLLLSASAGAQQFAPELRPAHLDTALTYFGFQDEPGKNNHGKNIEKWLGSVGLPQGNPYCAAFVSYCLQVSGAVNPPVRSALSSHFIRDNSIKAKHVVQRRETIQPGAILVFRRGNTMFGHVGFVLLEWNGATGITIEANTTTGTGGSQFNGYGVWIRQRTIYPLNHFRITHFTPYSYE